MGGFCDHSVMSEIRFGGDDPHNIHNRIVLRAREESLVVRGAPGSGRTTCAVEVLASAARDGQSVLLLVPDRARADLLTPRVQVHVPDLVRPVRTPAAFAYHVVDTFRRARQDPLGPLSLVTGARQEELLSHLLATVPVSWPDSLSPELRALPAFRTQIRNLFARAGEAGLDGRALEELGHQIGLDAWVSAGQLLEQWEHGEGFDVRTRGTMEVDLSRIQHLAADLLTSWDEIAQCEGLTAPAPRSDVVIVDDLQDCTASTVEMLAAMAQQGTRVVAFSDPDVAVSTYRGGQPHLDGRLAQRLGTDICELGPVHRGGPLLREFVSSVTSGITQSGPAGRRHALVYETGERQVAAPEKIETHVGASQAQLGALIARLLRAHYLHEGIAWEKQVVIVRSAAAVARTRRHLRRAGVPLGGASQAFIFSAEPVTRVLLTLLCPPDNPDDVDEYALALVSSAYVSVDALELHGALAAINAEMEKGSAPVGLVDLLEEGHLRERIPQASTREALDKAARLWACGRQNTAKSPSHALWELWEGSSVAEQWRNLAVRGSIDAELYDDRLDAIVALMRVADVWEQRNPGADAQMFAQHLLAEKLPVDTITSVGQRPPGVEVLTPAQAVGREWEVVCVLDLHEGVWPDLRLRDRLLRTDVLADLVAGRLPQDHEGRPRLPEDARAARRTILDDERRLFAASVSRSTRVLHLGTVLAEDSAPSPFLDIIPGFQQGCAEGRIVAQEVPPPLDIAGHVGSLRHIAAAQEDSVQRQRATTLLAVLAREGIRAADPATWIGAGHLSSTTPVSSLEEVVVSPSSFERVLDNPMEWFLSSVGATEPATETMRVGTLVHDLAREYPRGRRAELLAALKERWTELEIDTSNEQGRRAYDHAEEMVGALADHIEAMSDLQEIRVEVPFDVRISGVRVRGRIDRLERVEDGWRIIDFKTAKDGLKTKMKNASDNAQLALYQLALAALGMPCVEARLAYLGHGDVRFARQEPLDEETKAQWEEKVQQVAEIMCGPIYRANIGGNGVFFGRKDPLEGLGNRSIE